MCEPGLLSSRHPTSPLTHFFQVHHFFETACHTYPNFRILSPPDTATVKQREDPVALAKTFLWTCNRCTHFFPDFVHQDLVVQHLQVK